jgi:Ca2+:H+ antiporter
MPVPRAVSLKQAHKHWTKLRVTVRVAGAFKIVSKEANREKLLQTEAGDDDEDRGPVGNLALTKQRLMDSPINTALLAAVPIGIIAAKSEWQPWMVFWLNFLAIIPLSAILTQATEDISSYTNEVIAGLLNATFGNVVEMLVAFMALYHRDIVVVQSTLLGSILSNLLFVLGSCFLYGGLQVKELTFSSKAASTCTSLLLLASIALVLPTTMYSVIGHSGVAGIIDADVILSVSRYTSIVIFVIYLQFLYFQLVSHADYFEEEQKEDDDDDEPRWGLKFALLVLAIMSVLTAYSADSLVASIHGYAADFHLGKSFIGLILVASVGNIPEFYVTLMMAKNDKLDLALTIAVGSSCQMALLVTPFAVLCGWALGVPMSLDFHMLQMVSLLLAVLTVSSVIQGGSATWLHGSLLIGSYIIIAMMFFFLPF